MVFGQVLLNIGEKTHAKENQTVNLILFYRLMILVFLDLKDQNLNKLRMARLLITLISKLKFTGGRKCVIAEPKYVNGTSLILELIKGFNTVIIC